MQRVQEDLKVTATPLLKDIPEPASTKAEPTTSSTAEQCVDILRGDMVRELESPGGKESRWPQEPLFLEMLREMKVVNDYLSESIRTWSIPVIVTLNFSNDSVANVEDGCGWEFEGCTWKPDWTRVRGWKLKSFFECQDYKTAFVRLTKECQEELMEELS